MLALVHGELFEHLGGERIGKILGELLEGLVGLDGVLQKHVELLAGELPGGRFHGGHGLHLIRSWPRERSRRPGVCIGTRGGTAPRALCTSRPAWTATRGPIPRSLPLGTFRTRRRRR